MAKSTKNTATQALLDLDEMQANLREASRNTIKALLQEAVKDELNASIEDEDEKEDDAEEYTINDTAAESDDEVKDDAVEETEDGMDADEDASEDEMSDKEESEDEESAEDSESDDDKWSEFDKYKDEDGDYDFSGEEGEEAEKAIAKVYKLLQDTDEIIVKKDGEKVDVKIPETGSEYVIDFGSDSEGEVEKLNENEMDEIDLEDEFNGPDFEDEGIDDEEESADIQDGDVYGDDDADEFEAEGPMGIEPHEDEEFMAENNNSKKARKTMKENKDVVLFEVDLGYTDNYQDKDAIEGLSAAEPAKDKNDWDEGVPAGTKKPWAGKGDSAPFEKQVNEEKENFEDEVEMPKLEEGVCLGSEANNRLQTKSAVKRQTKKGFKKVSKGGKYVGDIKEDIDAKLEKVMAENKALKEAALALKKNLQEAILVNVNLGQVVKLLQENTTTKAEKIDIINRFDNVKSLNESKNLYESISRELASTTKNVTLEEKQMTAAPTKLNESKVYENPAINEIRNMMSRMDNYKK